ncbi:MAG: RNA methyltransferase [Saprospirales bacterium]|nr:RNA methyltransferase [Saprospirales bacterium]
MIQLPDTFAAQMQGLLGQEYPAFLEALEQPAPVSIRLHPAKPSRWGKESLETVPWHPDGRYLTERPVFTLDPLFQAGAYYVQEASSMLIAEAVRQLADLNRPLRALDLCAAPGGKTTLLASLLPEDSLLIANEVIQSRTVPLRHNIAKWGLPHVWACNHDSREFEPLASYFDLVLVDAPCSGEGLFRKDSEAISEWSLNNVELCCGRQKRILADAAPLLAPGGILLYSTCTYNQQEDSENARWLASEFGLEYRPLQFPSDWGIADTGVGYQCYPHRVKGEGFFLACFQKPGTGKSAPSPLGRPNKKWTLPPRPDLNTWGKTWIHPEKEAVFLQNINQELWFLPAALLEEALFLSSILYRLLPGQAFGQQKGKDLVPAPELALSTWLHPEIPSVELDQPQALRFMRKEPLEGISGAGWHLMRYEGLGLGWAKLLPNRLNNYFPTEWRIRMSD